MDGVLVRDVSGSDKDTYYVVFKKEKKIYKVRKGVELDLVKRLNVIWRWYDDEFNTHLRDGFELVDNLDDLGICH